MLRTVTLMNYSARPYAKVLTELSEKYKPSIFLFPASPLGRDLAPRVMCDLRTGLTADAIDLDIDEDGVFVQTTPNFGGNASFPTSVSWKSGPRWSRSTRRCFRPSRRSRAQRAS